MKELIEDDYVGIVRRLRGDLLVEDAADERNPFNWQFSSESAGGGPILNLAYHLIDSARFLIGEIKAVCAQSVQFVGERPVDESSGGAGESADPEAGGVGSYGSSPTATVDVEDAGAALVEFADGARGILEVSRVATGSWHENRIEVNGSRGAVSWSVQRIDEFVAYTLRDDRETRGVRRVLVNSWHTGASNLLLCGGATSGIGWLGPIVAMWKNVIDGLAADAPIAASFQDGVRANSVVDAIYTSSASGGKRTHVQGGVLMT